jgi:hypothetical protein
MTGCAVGMLLFYRDSKTSTIYKSSDSKKDYYIVNATTLSHCGCTDLHIDNYKNGKKEFNLFYNGNIARKTIYKFDSKINQRDILRLVATSNNDYTTPFDSLDIAIFNRIDSIAIQKPKGIVYQIKRTEYKGFINDPYYNH